MSFFISDAMAEGAAPQGGGFELLIMMGIFFAVMYFMIIRPQQKRTKEHKAMLESLNKGDEIVTSGGILGKVTGLSDNHIDLEVSDGVVMKVQKVSVGMLLPKGTIKQG